LHLESSSSLFFHPLHVTYSIPLRVRMKTTLSFQYDLKVWILLCRQNFQVKLNLQSTFNLVNLGYVHICVPALDVLTLGCQITELKILVFLWCSKGKGTQRKKKTWDKTNLFLGSYKLSHAFLCFWIGVLEFSKIVCPPLMKHYIQKTYKNIPPNTILVCSLKPCKLNI
jgi:hypothetical protein